MNIGDLFISLFVTALALINKLLANLPEVIMGERTILTVSLFALSIRVISLPLFFHQRKIAERWWELQPRLDRLSRLYADNREKLTQAQLALYQEAGVHPLTGCGLAFIQLPFVFGLYSAITAAMGGTPFQPWGLQGHVLISNLADFIPLPAFFFGIDLGKPYIALAIFVSLIASIEGRLANKEQVNNFSVYVIALAIGILSATLLVSGVSIFIITFLLLNIVLYLALENAGLRRLFLGREETRRWELKHALKSGSITANRFDQLTVQLFRLPELNQEDISLAIKLLELGLRNFNSTWPQTIAGNVGKVLTRLSEVTGMQYDLGALYQKFAEICLKVGHKEQAIDLATQGYNSAYSTPAAKTACVLLLGRSEAMDQQAKSVYKAFLAENTLGSPSTQELIRNFQEKGAITVGMDKATVTQRIPFNTFLAELFSSESSSWIRSNLGLAHLILDELEPALRYFEEAFSYNTKDATAAQGQALVLFRLRQYEKSLQIVQTAQIARITETGLNAIKGFCQAARWLADIQVNNVDLQQLQALMQTEFPMDRFLGLEADFTLGRLAAILGDWESACRLLQAANCANKDDVRLIYHYANALQISGEWEQASKILMHTKVNTSDLLCLKLKQCRHDTGIDQIDQALARFTADLNADNLNQRLVSAKYALLTEQAANIPPWPTHLSFETSEQADEWASIWLSALIGRGATSEARKAMASQQSLRLPRPEQLLLTASINWLAKDQIGAEKELSAALKLAPNYEGALRLSAALTEIRGDTYQANLLLERLLRVAPKDNRSRLRGALLRWRQGEEKAAIAQLQGLVSDRKVGALSNFWLGRLLLIQATRPYDHSELQRAEKKNIRAANAETQDALRQASEYLKSAAKAGISNASWYGWLCAARKEYNPKTGWEKHKAEALFNMLPSEIGACPVVEVATVAALVAIETSNPSKMLDGYALMIDLLKQKRTQGSSPLISLDNWSEALWRIAAAATSLNDRLRLSHLCHQVDESLVEYRRIAQQVADTTLMSTLTAMSQSGANWADALEQIEAVIQIMPNALIPRLARTSLLTQKGEITAQEAVNYLSRESQPAIAQALEVCVQLTANEKGAFPSFAGLAAFLTINKANLVNISSSLQTLAGKVSEQQDAALLTETARCMATIDLHDDAVKLLRLAHKINHSPILAKELSDYLCYMTARLKSTYAEGMSFDNLKKAQHWLSLAQHYGQEVA